MKKIYSALFFLLFLASIAVAQNLGYKQFFPARINEQTKVAHLDVQQVYRLSERELIVIGDAFETNSDYGLHLVYLKRSSATGNYQEVFRSHGAMESTDYNPSFFKASDNSIVIICSAGSKEKPWGEKIFLLEAGNLKDLGMLNVVMEKEGHYQSILPHLTISKEAEKIYFRADSKPLIASYSHLGIQPEKHGKIEYVYENEELHAVKSH